MRTQLAAILMPIALCVSVARAATITFEEPIPLPETVSLQYCYLGVEFLGTNRLFAPAVATQSPPNALTNDIPGDELGEFDELEIRFTAPQSRATVRVGLHRDYPTGSTIRARLEAYASPTPGVGLLAMDVHDLGTTRTPITQRLAVETGVLNIRSLRIRFQRESEPPIPAFEVIDNLSFNVVGPPCSDDTEQPTVQITEPSPDGVTILERNVRLGFNASDDTRVARVDVAFLEATGAELSSFSVCGGERLACPTQPDFSRLFLTELPPDTARIRVTAMDFFGGSGFDERTIDLRLPGPDMNLWAESMEITQATQSWLPVNTASRSTQFPTFDYPDIWTTAEAVPLVAGRTTVVRLTAGVEGTADEVPVVGARARMRCFTDPSFSAACPGPLLIQPESRPPESLRDIVVDPADELDAKRRDLSRSFNFVLPRDWTDQPPPVGSDGFSLYLEAQVVPPAGIAECDGCDDAANRLRVSGVEFRRVPSFSEDLMHQVRIRRERPSTETSHTPTLAEVAGYIDYLRKTYPVDETTISPFLPILVANHEDAAGNVFCDNTAAHLAFPKNGFGACCADGSRVVASYMGGDLDNDGDQDCGNGGRASGDGFAKLLLPPVIQPGSFYVMAQEIGHANGGQPGPRRGFLYHAGPPPGHGTECDGRCLPNCTAGAFKDCNCNDVEDPTDVENGTSPDVNDNNVPDQCECRQDSDCASGLCDVQCDRDWPWEHGVIGEFGFDVFDFKVWPGGRTECETPGVCDNGIDDDGDGGVDEECVGLTAEAPFDLQNDPHDFMSYGGCSYWISPRTWVRILNGFTGNAFPYASSPLPANKGASAAADPRPPAASRRGAAAPTLLVGARSDHEGRFSLQTAYEVDFVSSSADEGDGEFRIELRDAAGQVVAAHNFDLPPSSGSQGDEGGVEFNQAVPLPPGVASLVLLRYGEVIDQRTRSATAPTVSLTSPAATGFDGQPDAPVARWTGADADGDPLSYLVQYTTGGGAPWRTLATNLSSQELTIFLDELEGSAAARVRVLGSDGLSTAVAESPPFVVADKAPRVQILAPPDHAPLLPGERAVARGVAFDLEDGALAPETLVWSSDLDGVLGTGLDLDLAGLRSGVHQLTLAATDSEAQAGVATISVEVAPRVNAQPVADAGPDTFTRGGVPIGLNGNGSSDADGDPLDFHWEIVGQPGGGDATLLQPQVTAPQFSASVLGVYEVALVVDDEQVESAADSLAVLVCGDEINDGLDNECPDQPGFGVIDNLSGLAGFVTPGSPTVFSWPEQQGATGYQVARAASPDFAHAQGCVTFATAEAWLDDPEEPQDAGLPWYYLARPLTPLAGSWGRTSAGVERSFVCGNETRCDDGIDDDLDGLVDCGDPECSVDPDCLAGFTFVDTSGNDVAASSLIDFFRDTSAAASDWILFEITIPGRPAVGFCSTHAEFYRDRYLALAPTGGSATPSPVWFRYVRDSQTGEWVGGSSAGDTHRYGSACFSAGSWCPAQPALNAVAIRPAQADACEAYARGCGDGTWALSIRISPSREIACGF